MTNTYCIITNRISSLGGAQLYTLRRLKYLAKNGVRVKIVVTENQNFILSQEFEGIPVLVLNELSRLPFLLSETKQGNLIDKVEAFLQGEDSVGYIIETHTPLLSIWGELIANRKRCKHITYLLSEPTLSSNSNKLFKNYFIWKLRRKELYGITNLSLKLIFGDDYDDKFNNYVNVPYDEEELSYKTSPAFLDSIPDSAFVIATVSRLAKTYISKLIDSVYKLSLKYSDRKFFLIIAGDDIDKEIIKRLKAKYEGEKDNLSVVFPGYLNPLGKDFFERVNIFVGMGTAVINSISQACATITVEPITNKATGILGLTNSNFAYSESGIKYEIDELIESLILDETLLENAQLSGYSLFISEFSINVCMNKLDTLIENSVADRKYWDFSNFNNFPNKIKLHYRESKSKFFVSGLKMIGAIRSLKNS